MAILTTNRPAIDSLHDNHGILDWRWPPAASYRAPAPTGTTGLADPIETATSPYGFQTFSLRHLRPASVDEARLSRLPDVKGPPPTAPQDRPRLEPRHVDASKLFGSPEWTRTIPDFTAKNKKDHDEIGNPAQRRRTRVPFEMSADRVKKLVGDESLDLREAITKNMDPSQACTEGGTCRSGSWSWWRLSQTTRLEILVNLWTSEASPKTGRRSR